ncbi:hypothetical protein NC653_037169 [Populus alba x Populus x berolinensis]|uniref:Uncharacterized protein n=1 Tax=Populus alba x Populus x berolinensis TaxID=444605 RepID=A0AAD6PRN8_9ROSI|nr:hypothetical protein NC653_037169 [Populus alba x Populus x berolinensis]
MEEPDSEPVDGTSVKDEPGGIEKRDLRPIICNTAKWPSQASDSKNATAEANMSNISEAHNDLALRSLPSGNTSQNDLMVSDSSTVEDLLMIKNKLRDTTEASGEIEDKNADDYAFVSEFEKEQIKHWDLPPRSRLSPMSM